MTDPTPTAAAVAPPRPATPPGPPALIDALPGSRPFHLDGWMERAGFGPALSAVLVFVFAFVLFNLAGAVAIGVALVSDFVASGAEPTPEAVTGLMEAATTDRPHLMLGSNAVGQLIGFALFALLAARLATRDWKPFLRVRTPDGAGLGLAALGWVALYPIVLWAGELNRMIPLPEPLVEFETMQTDMLEGLLMGGQLSTAFLLFTVALTPAICEELIFRGYLQRQVERRFGLVASIVAVGVLFGLYHLRLSQAIPLSILGVYLGFVVWATGSVWTGALVHLLNNGLAVLATAYVRETPGLDMDTIDEASVPIWAVLVAALALAVVVRGILARRHAVTGGRPDAQLAVPAPTPFSTPLPA